MTKLTHENFVENQKFQEYLELIQENLNTPKISGKTESHHILPRSMGGSNKKENLVNLSYSDHFRAHMLLVECTSGKAKSGMCFAISRMGGLKKYKTPKEYERIRIIASKELSKRFSGKNHPFYGKKHSEKSKRMMSNSRTGLRHSEETKEKMSHWRRKNTSNSVKKKISESLKGEKNPSYGKTRSKEFKEKVSTKQKGIPKKKEKCYVCGKEIAVHLINRYHNENCKFK